MNLDLGQRTSERSTQLTESLGYVDSDVSILYRQAKQASFKFIIRSKAERGIDLALILDCRVRAKSSISTELSPERGVNSLSIFFPLSSLRLVRFRSSLTPTNSRQLAHSMIPYLPLLKSTFMAAQHELPCTHERVHLTSLRLTSSLIYDVSSCPESVDHHDPAAPNSRPYDTARYGNLGTLH